MTMERAFFSLLKSVPDLNIGSGADKRIYALRAEQNAEQPFIVYQRINTNVWRSINNPSGIAQAEIQVDFYAKSYFDAKDMAAKVQAVIDGFRGQMVQEGVEPPAYTKFGGISLQNALETIDETAEPVLNRVIATYLVTYHY